MSALLPPMEFAAIFLLAPLAIIIGHRRPTGAIIASGAVATVAAVAFWIFLGGIPALTYGEAPSVVNSMIIFVLFYGGLLLAITAWTLALNSAAVARRWGWVFLLVVSGYISFTALIIAISVPNPCIIGQVVTYLDSGPGCAEANSLVTVAFYAAHVLGPAVALIYGLVGTSSPRPRSIPPDVRVTPLGAGEEDTEPELA